MRLTDELPQIFDIEKLTSTGRELIGNANDLKQLEAVVYWARTTIRGWGVDKIARHLGVNKQAVHSRLSRFNARIGARNRLQTLRWLVINGFIDLATTNDHVPPVPPDVYI